MVAGVGYNSSDGGIRLTCGYCENPAGDDNCYDDYDTIIYNNTLIDNYYNINFGSWTPSTGTPSVVVKNNISWIEDSAYNHINNCSPSGVTWDYNLWSSDPGSGGTDYCDDAQDPTWGDPGLVGVADWTALSENGLTGDEFGFATSTSNGYNEGTSITNYNDRITDTDFTATTITVTTDTDTTPFSVGAWLYGAGGISTPDYPLQGVAGSFKYN